MQNDSAPVAQVVNPAPVPVAPQSTISNVYETIMLVFGGLAILSLLLNIGFLLKVTAAIFLVVAIIAIISSLGRPRPAAPVASQQTTTQAAPKQRTVLKTIGLTIFILLLLPVLAYGALILFFIIALASGGGRMGT